MEEQPGQTLRTNIKRITRYVTDQITGWGFDVYLTISHTTKSRYIEFRMGKHRSFIIRISDHYTNRRHDYDYDVFTSAPRNGAFNYMDMLSSLKNKVFRESQNETG